MRRVKPWCGYVACDQDGNHRSEVYATRKRAFLQIANEEQVGSWRVARVKTSEIARGRGR